MIGGGILRLIWDSGASRTVEPEPDRLYGGTGGAGDIEGMEFFDAHLPFAVQAIIEIVLSES